MLQAVATVPGAAHGHAAAMGAGRRRAPQASKSHRWMGARVVVTGGPWAERIGTIVKRKKGGWWSIQLLSGEIIKERTGSFGPLDDASGITPRTTTRHGGD